MDVGSCRLRCLEAQGFACECNSRIKARLRLVTHEHHHVIERGNSLSSQDGFSFDLIDAAFGSAPGGPWHIQAFPVPPFQTFSIRFVHDMYPADRDLNTYSPAAAQAS